MAKTGLAHPHRLAQAAETLATELTRFEELTEALQRERVNSEKTLKRAAQRLQQIAESDSRLAEYVQTLVHAIAEARQRQEEQARSVEVQSAEIQQRAQAMARLQAQAQELQDQAELANKEAQQLLTDSNGSDEGDQLRKAFGEIQRRVHDLFEHTEALLEAARRDDFVDIARVAESLRAQLLASRNKLDLLERKLNT